MTARCPSNLCCMAGESRSILHGLLRVLGLWVVITTGSQRTCVANDEELPYTAYVTVEGAYYRSGPGANYYPTGKLPHGEAVEVYRHDRGGWCAIRPPLGSFSWVSGKHVKLTEDRLGVIQDDDVMAAVGSSFSDIREVQQVRLDRGEEIEMIDVRPAGQGPGDETWYKIAPPAGEFRWVSRDQISTEPPPPKSSKRTGRRNLLIDNEEQARRDFERTVARRADGDVDQDRVRRRADEPNDTPSEVPPTEKRESLIDGWLRLGRAQRSNRNEPDQSIGDAGRTSAAGKVRDADLTHELDLIELELSHMVAEEPTAWSFDDLRVRAEDALAQTTDLNQRARARLLVKRIKRFEDLRLRHTELSDREQELAARPADRTKRSDALAANATTPRVAGRIPVFEPLYNPDQRPTADRSKSTSIENQRLKIDNPPATAKIPAAAAVGVAERPLAATAPVADDRFDGMGKLTRVVSQKPGMPQYALMDESGAVRQYLTAAPGVNLRRYVGHQVGVNGMKGYLPELNAHHLTAKRITAMDGRVLR